MKQMLKVNKTLTCLSINANGLDAASAAQVWCSVLQCGVVCCSVLQCVAVFGIVLQCVANGLDAASAA